MNLALHVTGRRADGYHLLDSIVVFPRIGDTLEIDVADELALTVDGPFGGPLADEPDNLVLRAARLMGERAARLHLTKRLPIASGIGGGSADAAATLRLIARYRGRSLPDEASTLGLGADVPVCVASRPARMSGIGEQLEPLALPEFWLVLVNPGIGVATPQVFQSLQSRENAPLPDAPSAGDLNAWLAYLRAARNDLEAPATVIAPEIGEVISAISSQRGCHLARMSGSGATCFGLFGREVEAEAAAKDLTTRAPDWWVEAGAVRDELPTA